MGDDGAKRPAYPRIDLETVSETLAYMRDDMAASPDLAKVSQALSRAIDEIAAMRNGVGNPDRHSLPEARIIPFGRLKFVPWTARS